MKLEPPALTVGPLTGSIFVVTYGKVEQHPTLPDRTMVTASKKYDVTNQFFAIVDELIEQIIDEGDGAAAAGARLVRATLKRNRA